MGLKSMKVWLLGVLFAVLAACAGQKSTPTPQPEFMGLLKVTITGIGEGASPTATAEWVKSAGVSGQAATVVPVNGTANSNDVQLIRRHVGFLDNDVTGTRNISATFDLVNRTTINFDNFTLYAVNVPGNIGGTAIAGMVSGAGATITDPAVARSFKPTHGMRQQLRGLEVNPSLADLQFFTPEEVDNPTDGVKQQAIAQGILPSSATVLEYGFVARNYEVFFSERRAIAARNTDTNCTVDACKGTFTLAYQFPKLSPRANNPFGFSLYFVVANETSRIGSQSVEEQSANTVMGLNTFDGFSQLRTLVGSSHQSDQMTPICRTKYAILPNIFLGADSLPTAPGSLDVCFGASGIRTTDFSSDSDQANSVAIQNDGKIVVAGYTGANPNINFALARYNSNGTLDTTFGTGGRVKTAVASRTTVGSRKDVAHSLAIQRDGKIVAAGISGIHPNYDFALVRYNSDGSLDTTFGTGGKVTTDFGSDYDQANAVAIQSDDKIVLAGFSLGSSPDFGLARYNPDGSLDTSFGTGGKITTDFSLSDDQAKSLVIQSNGKIVVAGISGTYPSYDFALIRYNSDGSLDTSFDTDGKVTTDFSSSDNQANAIAIQSDGKIVLAGFSDTNPTILTNYAFALARYNSNGSLDTSFGIGGRVTTTIGLFSDQAFSMGIQSNGKIVVAGYSSISDFALARYNSNGSLDTSFGAGGKVVTVFSSNTGQANSLAIQNDGKIVLAGYSDTDPTSLTNYGFSLARYNP